MSLKNATELKLNEIVFVYGCIVILTSRTRTAIMAAAPVDTVQSIRITWSSLISLGRRK